MMIDINEGTLETIRDPGLRSYAGQYVRIYQNFMEQVRGMGVEIAEADDSQHARERIAALGRKGAVARNDGKSVYVNRISSGCQACQTAAGSYTFFVSLKCHRDCYFCFNPNQEDYEYHREHLRDTAAELDSLRASGQRVQHLALTGGEPLLHKPETVRFFQQARRNFPGAYTRLYTSGDHLERETLQAFKDAGMNEIRFSIRLDDTPQARGYTYGQIELARGYIPNVMVEMPVLPGRLDEMKDVLLGLDRLGVFGINLLELCFPMNNAEAFRSRGYRIKPRPFRVLYNYWYAGGLPVAGSEMACLDLVEFALDARLKLGVHYCSLENKHTGQVYQQNMKRSNLGTLFFSQKDYFLKTARIFGGSIPEAKRIFEKNGYAEYRHDPETDMLEFHVSKIRMLKIPGLEVGISTNVLEEREGELFLRELKVDVTNPQSFKLSDI